MKALVCVKRVPDPSAYLPLTADGQLDLSGVRHVVNPWDEIALDMAADLRASGVVSEVVAVSVSPAGCEDVVRAALARGADRAVLVDDDRNPGPQSVALRLAEVARREDPEFILCGKLASDSDDGQTASRLAGLLQRDLFVGRTEQRDAGTVGGVLTCDTRNRDPKPLPLRDILQARSKPVERLTPAAPTEEPAAPHVFKYSVPPPRPPCRFVADVAELVEALQTARGQGARSDAPFDLPDPRPATLYLGSESDAAALGTVAGRMGWPLVRGVLSVRRDGEAFRCRRYIHSGRYVAEVGVPAGENAILLVPDALRTDADRERIAALVEREATPVRHTDLPTPPSADLGAASVVVAGGRALKDAGTFERLVGGLADALGGAVAASGGAVNADIAPSHLLIGQTGRTVAPDLYVALGISGADQHVAGMRDARTVVAVNADADAPIFRFADYGLVGDLFALVPEWIAASGTGRG